MDLNGKVALVTGAGGGIGFGIAQALAERGMRVILTDVDGERCAAKAAELGGGTLALSHDVTSREDWARVREAAIERFGQVDVLCNNAGVSVPWEPVATISPESFDLAIKVNLYGVFNGIQTFAPDMSARKSGHIVNTSSFNGLISKPGMGAYGASKFGVTALTAVSRIEMAPHGVGVSGLYPGLTRSIMIDDLMQTQHSTAMDGMAMMDPIWVGRAVARAIENNEPHIITHPSLKPDFDAWFTELDASFGQSAQPGLPA